MTVLLTTLLSLFRVNSVYHNSRAYKVVFSVLWFTTAVGALCIPFSFTAASAEPQKQCVIASVDRLMLVPAFALGTFDVIVYLSISYRMTDFYSCMQRRGWERCKQFFTGTDTGPISSTLLHTGQLYFLCVLFPYIQS